MHNIAGNLYNLGNLVPLKNNLNGMANSRMAYDKSGMGCRSFSNRMHNTLLFSNPSWMATKTRCKKRRSMNNGLPTTYINTCPAIFVSPCKRNY